MSSYQPKLPFAKLPLQFNAETGLLSRIIATLLTHKVRLYLELKLVATVKMWIRVMAYAMIMRLGINVLDMRLRTVAGVNGWIETTLEEMEIMKLWETLFYLVNLQQFNAEWKEVASIMLFLDRWSIPILGLDVTAQMQIKVVRNAWTTKSDTCALVIDPLKPLSIKISEFISF